MLLITPTLAIDYSKKLAILAIEPYIEYLEVLQWSPWKKLRTFAKDLGRAWPLFFRILSLLALWLQLIFIFLD